SLVLERILSASDLVRDRDEESGVEEREFPEASREDLIVELDLLEDLIVRTERDRGAGALGRAYDFQLRGLLAPFEPHPMLLAVPPDADLQPFAQAVDDGQADAVQAAGDAVHLPLELPAAVHAGQDQLDARDAVLGMQVDRDPAAVVRDGHRAVLVERDLERFAAPRRGPVHRLGGSPR